MFLKNVVARLITINTPDGKEYPIIPSGAAVEIKSDLGIAKEFVDSLVESGDLVEVAGEKTDKPKSLNKAQLEEYLIENDIEYPSTATKAELQAIYEANQGE